MQLARAVRNRTTGVLYVLDEPSIGLHPSNITGLTAVMDDLVADGNSVLLVDHDTQILSHADWIIEMGPEAGARGGQVVAQGTVRQLEEDPVSRIGPFLSARARPQTRRQLPPEELFAEGRIRLATGAIHTVKPLEVDLPKGRLTVVTGAIPAFKALNGRAMFIVAGAPACMDDLKAAGIENFIHVRVNVLDTLKEFNAKLLK